MEEYVINLIQRNPEKVLFGEPSIILDKDCAYLYLWDNGEIFDWTDPDNQIITLSTYVLNNLLGIVKKTAVEAARSIVLLASGLFEDVNRVYGEQAE